MTNGSQYGKQNLSRMFTINIHLLQLKVQSHLQKRGLWISVNQNSYRRKPSKISNIIFLISPFSYNNTLTKLASWVLWGLLLLMKPSDAFQMVYSSKKNAKSRARQSLCVTYAQPTHLILRRVKCFKTFFFDYCCCSTWYVITQQTGRKET